MADTADTSHCQEKSILARLSWTISFEHAMVHNRSLDLEQDEVKSEEREKTHKLRGEQEVSRVEEDISGIRSTLAGCIGLALSRRKHI